MPGRRIGPLTQSWQAGSTTEEQLDTVGRRWRSFSHTGVPGDDWPRYTTTDRATMIFDRLSRVEADPASLRRQAWADFNAAKQIRSRMP